jgi:hypothetical protein
MMQANSEDTRALIYSFQMEAARHFLRENGPSLFPDKTLKRFLAAIDYNLADPLLPEVENRQPSMAGTWWTRWPIENRLRITGTVREDCLRVGLFVNDRLVKLVNTVPRYEDPMRSRMFRFNMKPDILRVLPRKVKLGIGSEVGYLQHRNGGLTYRNPRLAGNAKIFRLLSTTHFLTKKGTLKRKLDGDERWKSAALSAYTHFRNYFEGRFGYKPYIICGTLLGYHREGDFIAHDDDMDVAYFSDRTDPKGVKEELKEIVLQLISDGYDIKLARKPGFFKPCVNGFWFDVFPMWSDRGCLWMMNTTRQRASPDIILPLNTGNFKGVDVYVPRNTERYIELEYGPNWRIPDPGYRSVAERGTADYLSESCMSMDEVKDLHTRVKKLAQSRSGVGQLSVADRDINAL